MPCNSDDKPVSSETLRKRNRDSFCLFSSAPTDRVINQKITAISNEVARGANFFIGTTRGRKVKGRKHFAKFPAICKLAFPITSVSRQAARSRHWDFLGRNGKR